jgi:hypothetical protein
MQAGSSDHVDQGIATEQLDLAAHEIGNTRLRYAKQPGGPRISTASAELLLVRMRVTVDDLCVKRNKMKEAALEAAFTDRALLLFRLLLSRSGCDLIRPVR